jgi:hypothetical protein
MSDEFDAVLAAVGPRLREWRRRSGATLTALSETTGIPIMILAHTRATTGSTSSTDGCG